MTESSVAEKYVRPPGAATLMHVALVCKDIDASLRFYREGLGFSRTYEWTRSATPTCPSHVVFQGRAMYIELNGSTYLELFPGGRDDVDSSAGPIQHIALVVDDVDVAYRNCVAAGGVPFSFDSWHGEPTTVELNGDPALQVRVAFVKGPAGELVELYEQHGPVVTR